MTDARTMALGTDPDGGPVGTTSARPGRCRTGPDPATQPAKIQYLEGLRGIAAVQVVLLHFVTGFLPDTAEHAAPPLQVLWDGHTAVYVFFLISGAVLTPSFARGGPWPRQVAKRLVRLGLPIAAAAIIRVGAAGSDAERAPCRSATDRVRLAGHGFQRRDDTDPSVARDHPRQSGTGLPRIHFVYAHCRPAAIVGTCAQCAILVVASGTIWIIAVAWAGAVARTGAARPFRGRDHVRGPVRHASDVFVRPRPSLREPAWENRPGR